MIDDFWCRFFYKGSSEAGSTDCETDLEMNHPLIYWRDYAANWTYQLSGERAFSWHSSAKCIAELQPGVRM